MQYKQGFFLNSRLVSKIIKNSGCQERLVFCLDENDQKAFLPSGLVLFKATKSKFELNI